MKKLHFSTIDSTHLFAKRNLSRFTNDPITVITADFQTAGTGSRRNKWIAPKSSSLLLTFVFPAPSKKFHPYLANLCALSMINTLSFLNIEILFKYPNDLTVHGRKLAGFLGEICDNQCLCSVGLNLYQSETDLECIDQPATSLLIETGKATPPSAIIDPFLAKFFNHLAQVGQNFNRGMNFSF